MPLDALSVVTGITARADRSGYTLATVLPIRVQVQRIDTARRPAHHGSGIGGDRQEWEMYVRLQPSKFKENAVSTGRRLRLVALAGMTLAFTLLPLAVAEAQAPRSCGLAVVQGTVEIERGGQRRNAEAGAVLGTSDRLLSGPDARAEIRCNDGIRINVGADTRLEMSTLVAAGPASQSVVLRLLNGIVRVALPAVRSWRRFEVQTPTAVASVRATDWIVQAESTGATAVFTVEGQVLVADRAGSQGAFLGAGEGIDFRANGEMVPSMRWGEARVQRTLAAVMPR
jgi:hypothetical protein